MAGQFLCSFLTYSTLLDFLVTHVRVESSDSGAFIHHRPLQVIHPQAVRVRESLMKASSLDEMIERHESQ